MRALIVGLLMLCGACASPMVRSIDLTRATSTPPPSLITYSVALSEIEVRQLPYGGADALPADCAAALATYKTARDTHGDRLGPYSQALGQLIGMLRGLDGRTALTNPEKQAFLTRLKALLPLASNLVDAQRAADRAGERVGEGCPREPTRLDILMHVRPSPDHLFALNLTGGELSNDSLKVVTDANGLPQSITATADDQTAAAVESVARLVGRFSAGGGVGGGLSAGGGAAPLDDATLGFTATETCRLAALPAVERVAEMERRKSCLTPTNIIALLNELVLPLTPYPDLTPPDPAPPMRYWVSDLTKPDGVKYAVTGIAERAVELRTSCVGLSGSAVAPLPVGRTRPPLDGVVVTTPVPCLLIASKLSTPAVVDPGGAILTPAVRGQELSRFNFMGMSSDHLTVVAVDRASLVKNTTTLTFQNGMVTTTDVSRPSVGAAVAGLPGQAITSIVGGITDAFKDSQAIEEARVAQMGAETRRLEAEAARIATPTPAWREVDTQFVNAQGTVAVRQAEYDTAMAGTDETAKITTRNALNAAKAAANSAAVAAERPLPYPNLI